jgi:NAD(P)-dependent dehydrogenase (short-subunit alcohol dehydrogenase family)
MSLAFMTLLRNSGHGRIVNVSCGAGSYGDEQIGLRCRGGAAASYGISKAALNALTVTMAVDLRDTGVLVNAVSRSKPERYTMTPVCLVLAVASFVVATG